MGASPLPPCPKESNSKELSGAAAAEAKREETAREKMRSMMMGLRVETKDAIPVRMPDRTDSSLRARFLSLYRGGVFITVYSTLRGGDSDFVLEPHFFNLNDRRIHKVSVPEIETISSAVVAGQTAWFTGTKGGKSVLVGIKDDARIGVTLPLEGDDPQLGLNGDNLLAVYTKEVFELVAGKWVRLHSSEHALPRSGSPPELHGRLLFFRDEGSGENQKRLHWLTIGEQSELTSLDEDVKVVGSNGPRWENSLSYAITDIGDLWASVGEGYARKSLLRRSPSGAYSIAIMNNSVAFTPDLFGSEDTDQGFSISAVKNLPNGDLLLAGDAGLYRLSQSKLSQKFSFKNTQQKISLSLGGIYDWSWDPSNILPLGPNNYVISGAFGGIYLLSKAPDARWHLESLDEELGSPIVW